MGSAQLQTTGAIRVNGVDATAEQRQGLRRLIGFVPQVASAGARLPWGTRAAAARPRRKAS